MKKEIEKLINSEDAFLNINPFCTLHRWTKSAIGEQTDSLTATFHVLSSADRVVNIENRDWVGIVEAIGDAQEEFFSEIAKKLNSDLGAGYIYGNAVREA